MFSGLAIPDVLKVCPLLYTILLNFNSMSENKFSTGCMQIELILGFYSNDKMQLYSILGQPLYIYICMDYFLLCLFLLFVITIIWFELNIWVFCHDSCCHVDIYTICLLDNL